MPESPTGTVAATFPCGILPAPLPHPAMATFLTVKEAALHTGKSTSSIRRIIYPIIHDDKHPDREHIQPSVEEALQLRVKGENFPWKLSEELLRREVPTDSSSKKEGPASFAKASAHADGDLVAMLRGELQIKNQQIVQQGELIARQMELINGLSERLREGNILMGTLQQRLSLPDGRTGNQLISAKTKRTPSTQPEKGSTMAPKPAKPKKSFLSRLFG